MITVNFNEKVWNMIRKIPMGNVATYGQIARSLKNPEASRAVGNACNKNPDSPNTPCHRVISGNGKLGGFASGSKKKIRLLLSEGIKVNNNKIIDFNEVLVKQEDLM